MSPGKGGVWGGADHTNSATAQHHHRGTMVSSAASTGHERRPVSPDTDVTAKVGKWETTGLLCAGCWEDGWVCIFKTAFRGRRVRQGPGN